MGTLLLHAELLRPKDLFGFIALNHQVFDNALPVGTFVHHGGMVLAQEQGSCLSRRRRAQRPEGLAGLRQWSARHV
ncbi:hypothetical protein [Mesorhizobium sp. L2C066B000]|uniref:hypothetical protein n=1 Tax=Mesorhizobium sp. L2C066B000 TaxID=1287105 RepID=UPI000A8BCA7F|nr:hypothetical protein [Mesorhizobium sp. L2C066B000]